MATITYAAAVWWRRTTFYAVRSALLRTQRPALVLLTKAYRSVSTASLPVLAATLPADLEVVRAGRIAQECSELATSEERNSRKNYINREVIDQWQDRWSSSADGRDQAHHGGEALGIATDARKPRSGIWQIFDDSL